ncbi:MAG: PEP-CTERM sorting domain-containing protein [Planctomycetales bacterium]|nr:PEP-CTERM sorting domain-containing protein [Planctomycetales bacterium]
MSVQSFRAFVAVAVLFVCGSALGQINRDMPKFTITPDGVVSDSEKAGQLEVPMIWPVETGAIPLENAGSSEEEISAIWYVSWDDINLNIAAVVKDDSPLYQLDAGDGNVAYNAQDVMQPVFNPFNNHDHFFEDGLPDDLDPGDSVAAIYDIVVQTADEFGPDIYRHGPKLNSDEWESITVTGTINDDESGYTVEVTIPWATAMDDAAPNYKPEIGDEHGLSFIVLSFFEEGGADKATLFTDFGEGSNTIGDPTTWNTVTLVGPVAEPGDFNTNGQFDTGDLDLLLTEILSGNNSPAFDVDSNGIVNSTDQTTWVKEIANTWIGDSNLDGEFNSTDFVVVFGAGQYEDSEALNSTWATGDWNGDGEFNSSDFVAAFTDGGYERGLRPAAVPEPSGVILFGIAAMLLTGRRRIGA